METQNNIDQIIKNKFDSFEPTPPPHVWDEVSKGIDSKAPLVSFNKKWLAGSLILLLGISSFIVFDPFDIIYGSSPKSDDSTLTTQQNDNKPDSELTKSVVEIEAEEETEVQKEKPIIVSGNKTRKAIPSADNDADAEKEPEVTRYNSDFGSGYIGSVGMKHGDFLLTEEIQPTIDIIKMPAADDSEKEEDNSENEIEITEPSDNIKKGHWAIGFNIWPELTVSNIDSVEILNSYSFNVEPTYFFNKHWFLRSGIGASYTRDRGFAEIKYYVKELMGTYEDVYNVTFDSIDGVVVPTYHTKTIEVWDSIKQISISNVTNKYLYLNVPLLFGYSSGDDTKTINWHAFAGPIVYFNASKWIDEPSLSDKDAEIIELHNTLPVRNNYYLQLWVGAGINYRINERLGLNVEPSYFYYITDVYKNKGVSSPRSGFGLRVGLQFKLK